MTVDTKQLIQIVDDMLEWYDNTPDRWYQGDFGVDSNGNKYETGEEIAYQASENATPTCLCIEGCVIYCSVKLGLSYDDLFEGIDPISDIRRQAQFLDIVPYSLNEWNDDPATTFEDVKQLLRAVKAKLEERAEVEKLHERP